MPQFCPLCGKNKSEEALFCDNCKNKIEKEYEVDVPQKMNETADEPEPTQSENRVEEVLAVDNEEENPRKRRGRKSNFLIGLLVLAVLLVGGFFYYGQVIRKNNLDKSQWDTAVKENSISGYLAYMQAFPKGKYYNEAEKSLMTLKTGEAKIWEKLHASDNTAELRDFMKQYPESAYNPLIKKRLDSLTWMATLNDNTAESYSKYMVLSQSGEFEGDYFGDAQQRYDLLFQSYPVAQNELDSIKMLVDGFFTALSAVKAKEMGKYLAPQVFQFFNAGGDTREKIIGDLLISGSKTQAPTIKFTPDINAVAYEKTLIEHYKVNVPVQKTFTDKDGRLKTVSGYIVQMELDRDFLIITISEKKPTPDAV